MGAWFTTREAVGAALDIKETARAAQDIDRAIETASRYIEGKDCVNRRIAPRLGTHLIEWPERRQGHPSWIAQLGHAEVIEATEVKTAGQTVTGWTLEPSLEGPPFTRVEMPESGAGFNFGAAAQNNLEISGLFGLGDDRADGGTLAAALAATDVTATVARPGRVGVGSVMVIGGERITVTGRGYTQTGAIVAADLADSTGAVSLEVSDGTRFEAGQLIMIGAERMRVDAVNGDTLAVGRAVDGSTLAAHSTGADISDRRLLYIYRGDHGTTAAAHGDGAAVSLWKAPGPIESLCIAEAISIIENDRAAWARVVGSGDVQREAKGSAVEGLRERVKRTYGRKHRMRAV